ncbi:MAG: gliding motility-associated C-terminal domain-containing protein, partial [Flavobacteriales bacterium]
GTIGNINSNNFTDPSGIGNTGLACYYITTNFNNGGLQVSSSSDTLCNIYLQNSPSINPGYVTLEWNDAYWLGGTSSSNYDLYVEFPLGVWTLVESIPYQPGYNYYEYEVTECSALLNFQVQFQGQGGCFSVSNTSGDIYTDEADALPPIISYVTVDSLVGDAILEWEPSVSPDVAGYIIYECLNNFTFAIDTIFDPLATSYQNLQSTANIASEGYTIAAFDNCLAMGEPDPGPASPVCHETILLSSVWQACQTSVTLNWSAYVGWPEGVLEYNIFAHETDIDGIAYPSFLLGTVDGSTLTYEHENANLSSTYRYSVEAVQTNGSGSSSSNTYVQLLFYPAPPLNTRIATASVSDDEEVTLIIDVDETSAFNNTYTLERKQIGESEFGTFEYEFMDSFLSGIGVSFIDFIDSDVKTNDSQYDYRVIVKNGCDDNIDTTTAARPMLLTGISNNDQLKNTLFWTPYQGWDAGIDSYRIYRSNNKGELGNLLVELPGGVINYEDDVSDLLFTPGEFCYTIEAIENTGGTPFTSFSNQRCLTLLPKIWIPNAFLVGGYNDVFNPVISFADFEKYKMVIYGRWGDVMFTTEDITEGWDGTFKGSLAPQGVYAYFVTIQDGAGQVFDSRGTLTLLIADE